MASRAASATLSRPAWVAVALGCLGLVAAYASPARGLEQAVGTASLYNNHEGAAIFDASVPLGPGATRQACVTVGSSTADGNQTISLAATGVAGVLADSLELLVEQGRGGGGGDCTGFEGTTVYSGTLAGLAAGPGDGVDTGWVPASEPQRSFRFTVRVPSGYTTQGAGASGVFSWRLVGEPEPPPPPPTTPPPPPTTPTTPPTSPPEPTATPHTPSPSPTQTDTPGPTGSATTTATSTHPATSPTSTPTGAGGSGGPTHPDVTVKPPPGADPETVVTQALASALAPFVDPQTAEALGSTVATVVARPAIPSLVILAALIFLAIQHTVDSRDPKLARAALSRRDTELEFPDLFPGLEVTP